MAPLPPANLNSKERAARKAALTRSIKLRQAQIAKWRLYVRDEYLDRAMAKLEAEVVELAAQRDDLDKLDPDAAREAARLHLGFQRYER